LQGCSTDLEKPFAHADKDGHKVVTLKSGCFDAALQSGGDVKLLIDHDESQCLSTMNSARLQIHAGAKHLVFRFLIPGSSSSKFAELKDDYETYVPVSIGYDILKADDETIDGARVQTVLEARLTEVSILSKAPAVSTTYARVASWETCNALQEDYDSGRFELVGKVVSLHRTIKANGGPVAYAHMPSPYDRAANAFMRALQKYNDNHDSDGRFASGGGSDAATAGSSALNGARQAISTALRGAGAAVLAPGVAINAALTLAVELGAAILIGNANRFYVRSRHLAGVGESYGRYQGCGKRGRVFGWPLRSGVEAHLHGRAREVD
jgi:HK97 family phage prohead protease